MDEQNNVEPEDKSLQDNSIAQSSVNEQDKQGGYSKLTEGLSKVNQLRNDYKNSSGLGTPKKNNNKYKANNNENNNTDNKKDSNNGKMPDSVKKNKEATKGKGQSTKGRFNKAKQAMNTLKNAPDQAKRKINETAFVKGVRGTVSMLATPVAGKAAEKTIDTPLGEEPKEVARNSSNPFAAVINGARKLLEIITKVTVKKNLLTMLGPLIGVGIIILIVVFSVTGVLRFNTYSYAEGGGDTSQLDKEYIKFYENVNKVSSTEQNRLMIIAVLTTHKDNDFYACTDEEVENGKCVADEEEQTEEEIDNDKIDELSPSKLKSYMKKINKKLNSDNNFEEGDYNDPNNTGGALFRWLYSSFIEDYYPEYFNSGMNSKDIHNKKKELISEIYLYYKDLLSSNKGIGGTCVSASCPNGITVTGRFAGTYDLEDYVGAVIANENYYEKNGNIEAMKAQAVAARTYALRRTNSCTKSIVNSTNAQTLKDPNTTKESYAPAYKAAQETAGEVLTLNGNLISAEYDGFYGTCSGDNCTATYKKSPNGEQHTFSVPITFIPRYARNYFGHGRGMSQYASRWLQVDKGYNYSDILNYFYSSGVELSKTTGTDCSGGVGEGSDGSVSGGVSMPLRLSDPVNWRRSLSRGFTRSGSVLYKNGIAVGRAGHLGVDFAVSCGTPIYAIADGVVIKAYNSGYNDGYGKYVLMGHNKKSNGKYEFYIYYAHQSNVIVSSGQTISAGTQIGNVGTTGNSTGCHLHLEFRHNCTSPRNSCAIDPSPYLDNIARGKGFVS